MNDNSILAAQFVDEVEKFSRSKLNRKIELLRIYEEALKLNEEKEFEQLAFTAKYLCGLLRVVKTGQLNPEVKNIERVKKDFSDNMDKVIELIRKIIAGVDEELKEHFETTFFKLSQESLINLNELLLDLEWVKMYLNEIKRR